MCAQRSHSAAGVAARRGALGSRLSPAAAARETCIRGSAQTLRAEFSRACAPLRVGFEPPVRACRVDRGAHCAQGH
eukprot:3666635-Prymnesium_polylepis.1